MKIEIELLMLKLVDGERILRFSDPVSGLCLEKRLDPKQPVAAQTRHLRQAFLTLVERETGAAN